MGDITTNLSNSVMNDDIALSAFCLNGPIITDIEDKTFKHGEKCYKYSAQSDKCDSTKRVIEVMSSSIE